jgi:hypothetical protein
MKNEANFKQKIYKLFLDLESKEKAIKTSEKINCLFYRRLCVCMSDYGIEIYDTSTDIYRPLTKAEMKLLFEIGIDDFCNNLVISSSWERIKNNRESMQLAIAKNNLKEKEYHYKIASEEIKILKDFLDINKI